MTRDSDWAPSRKEGWGEYVAEEIQRPDRLSLNQIRALSDDARYEYYKRRNLWHANLGPLETPQLKAIHDKLWATLNSNQQRNDKAKAAVGIDGPSGIGKTMAVMSQAKAYHLLEVAEYGPTTSEGHERWPVCRVGLSGNPTVLQFSRDMLRFYARPIASDKQDDLTAKTLDLVMSCQTRLLIVDDIHFLKTRFKDGRDVSDQFKHIVNEFPVTLVSIGVGLTERGIFAENASSADVALAQTLRRTSVLQVEPFQTGTKQHRRDWHRLLVAIESRLVLARKYPGMLSEDLSDYLFTRSTGHILSLMNMIQQGCEKAMRTGAERLTRRLLDPIVLDLAAEQARTKLEEDFDAGRKTTRLDRD